MPVPEPEPVPVLRWGGRRPSRRPGQEWGGGAYQPYRQTQTPSVESEAGESTELRGRSVGGRPGQDSGQWSGSEMVAKCARFGSGLCSAWRA